jgi:hypothetical protein
MITIIIWLAMVVAMRLKKKKRNAGYVCSGLFMKQQFLRDTEMMPEHRTLCFSPALPHLRDRPPCLMSPTLASPAPGMTMRDGGLRCRNAALSLLYRRFFRFFGGGVSKPPLQKAIICLVLCVIKVDAWRLVSALARPRAAPAAALAPLNHMLRNGFFLVQGFFMASFICVKNCAAA